MALDGITRIVLPVDANGNPIGGAGGTGTSIQGAANLASSQVTTAVTAGTLAIARPTRRRCTYKNLDTSITVYIGPATVTALNGMEVKAGQSGEFTWVGLMQVIAASGTPIVAIHDEFG